jgi:hypothetical protein
VSNPLHVGLGGFIVLAVVTGVGWLALDATSAALVALCVRDELVSRRSLTFGRRAGGGKILSARASRAKKKILAIEWRRCPARAFRVTLIRRNGS